VSTTTLWVGFHCLIFFLLWLDLAVLNRGAKEVTIRKALGFTAFWVSLALMFAFGVYYYMGLDAATLFLTAYVVEESLSVDNLFVFLVIFTHFRVPQHYQHKVLFWGIIGALVMRAGFILVGTALISRFEWLMYVFGAFLLFTGIKTAMKKDEENFDPSKNIVVRLVKRFIQVTPDYVEGHFFVKSDQGKWMATPLFVALLVVETSDVIFAVDSIPAVLAVTQDPFIVYTSNVFAILGLRTIFFALAGMMKIFHYLEHGLSAILVFVGLKMLLHDTFHVPPLISLAIILAILTMSVIASVLRKSETEGAKE
jgi:tellurite resistance protein TerC